jgi:hypothetical protein
LVLDVPGGLVSELKFKGIDIQVPFSLPDDWESRVMRIANSYGLGVDRAYEYSKGATAALIAKQDDERDLDALAEVVTEAIKDDFSANLFGQPPRMKARIQLAIGFRPPERYESIVHAAAARHNCSAARVFPVHNGVDFDLISADSDEDSFAMRARKVVTSAAEILEIEDNQQPSASMTSVVVNDSTIVGSAITVGDGVNQVTYKSGNEQLAELLQEILTKINESDTTDDEKEDARFALERTTQSSTLEQAQRWLGMIKDGVSIAKTIPPETWERLLQLLGL